MTGAGGNTSEAAKVAFLSSPDAYEGHPAVIVIESSMSWVFLAGPLAFKMKKPIRRPFLDHSSLSARRRSCEQEVALNRRLAPDVYYGVVPLTRRTEGGFRIGGAGRPVETLVKMRRLSLTDMLDQRIAHGRVGEGDVGRVARLLARFYGGASPAETDPEAYVRRLRRYVTETVDDLQLRTPEELRPLMFASCRSLLAKIDGMAGLLRQRVGAGRIIEGHGDLRPEHVYLGEPPQIIDCLEFRRDLRVIDPADELSFLAMECEHLGDAAVGDAVLRECASAMNDPFPEALVRFHKSYRACLRARMALWHARDHSRWEARAGEYLKLAERYARTAG